MGYTQTAVKQKIQTAQVICPTQVLVLDRANGPAAILLDTVNRLMSNHVSVNQLDNTHQALQQLEQRKFDVLVIGVETSEALSVLPYIRVHHPSMAVMVVGYRVRQADRACAQHFHVQEIIDLPTRAETVKALATYLADRYLSSSN